MATGQTRQEGKRTRVTPLSRQQEDSSDKCVKVTTGKRTRGDKRTRVSDKCVKVTK